MKTLNLVFIGNDFYSKSRTMMSSIYEENTWKRYDWGFVQVALGAGQAVNIRPANPQEMERANQMLKEELGS